MIDAIKATLVYKDAMSSIAPEANGSMNHTSFKAILSGVKQDTQSINGNNIVVDLVSDKVKNTFASIGRAEDLSKKAIVGDANIMDVAVALNEADLKLKEIQSIRDKVLGAFNEIVKTPI